MLLMLGPPALRPDQCDSLVRLSACGSRIFVQANRRAVATEALVFSEGTCLTSHNLLLRRLRGWARSWQNVTIKADMACFYMNRINWPISRFSSKVTPPAKFQEIPFVGA